MFVYILIDCTLFNPKFFFPVIKSISVFSSITSEKRIIFIDKIPVFLQTFKLCYVHNHVMQCAGLLYVVMSS